LQRFFDVLQGWQALAALSRFAGSTFRLPIVAV
jgi:hypothetical protein